MTIREGIQDFKFRNLFNIVIAFIPYIDAEILAIIPGLRQVVPVDPIYLTELSWTERGRLAGFIVVPVIDGEILELLGIDLDKLIED